ncbi:hypothetical protein [Spiroplasma endosymbiont of Virgichneumon dumeticola]|uniref:hypothetical protein n=1 Tax=Spiroplasma endosymbiont of Virgichneumon dumeticola TaxID=3139323 RepID=UPI0035C8B1D3
MKRILKMLTAINFTGLSVLPIIACGTPSSNPTATMNGKVADQLRLTSNNGTITEKKVTINNTAKLDSVYWSIPGQGASATILLTDSTQNYKADNTESYDFIKTVFFRSKTNFWK